MRWFILILLVSFKVKAIHVGESSRSQEENIAKVADATSSEDFVVFFGF